MQPDYLKILICDLRLLDNNLVIEKSYRKEAILQY